MSPTSSPSDSQAATIDRLAYRFGEQVKFSQGYAPLYARLFGSVVEWLRASDREADPLVVWLVEAATHRRSLEVTNLLLAGLHRRVLAGEPDVAALAAYYPTVGGKNPPNDPALPGIFRDAILANQKELADFIHQATVQTNETARGLVWVLPLCFSSWSAVQLVDIGASAGLNLVADHRHYALVEPSGQEIFLNEASSPAQFRIPVQGTLSPLVQTGALPAITGRAGCDLSPFRLDTPADELTLRSFIWADQPHRLARLNEGITALREVQAGKVPVRLAPVHLPDELPAFLRTIGGKDPVMVYNTYMTVYLSDRSASLRRMIGEWAATQNRPVLWAQWEPAVDEEPPDTGWCAWTLDAWWGNEHWYWRLGWVHPHGKAAIFEPDFSTATQIWYFIH